MLVNQGMISQVPHLAVGEPDQGLIVEDSLFSGFRNIWARKAERAIEVEKTKTVWSFSSSIMIISFSLKSTSLTFFHIWISWKLLFPTMPHHILLLGQAWGEDESKTWGKLGGGWKAAASQGSGDMMMIIFVSSLSRLISKQKSCKA